MSLHCAEPSGPTVGCEHQREKSKTRLYVSGYHLLSDAWRLMARNYKRPRHRLVIREANEAKRFLTPAVI